MTAEGRPDAGGDVIEQALARLRGRGGRVTTARRLLLRALHDSGTHLSAERLAADVQARAPDVHLTTIYRNLDELERLGVIDRTRLGHGPATYHLTSAAHGHLACETCGTVTEVPSEVFAGLAQAARGSYGFDINPRHFAATGRCARCRPP